MHIHSPFSYLFGFQGKVDRKWYLIFGVALSLLKYAVEALVIFVNSNKLYTPIDFVSPLLSSREYFASGAPWLGMAWLIWTLPFVWIAVTMSVRRCIDAELSPWLGLVVLVPIVNLIGMIVLAALPSGFLGKPLSSDANDPEVQEQITNAFAAPMAPLGHAIEPMPPLGIAASLLGIFAGAAYLTLMVVLSVSLLGSYGAALFFGTPIITGAVASFIYNRQFARSLGGTILHASLTMLVTCLGFLCFGIEGVICIAMAVPIMMPLGLLGSLLGRAIAISVHRPGQDEYRGLVGCIVVLPFLALVESRGQTLPLIQVTSAIEIDAPIQVVWNRVVDFPEIDEEPDWIFQLGIGSPERAHIDGQGVGAIRYCEFSTGVFVEPITIWDEPVRLAFDVSQQPEPMFELTPYRNLHPPHLKGSFRSLRGEFRLTALDTHRTLLEGSTWYQLDIHPFAYWSIWTDWIVHRIHRRVLNHIQLLAEKSAD